MGKKQDYCNNNNNKDKQLIYLLFRTLYFIPEHEKKLLIKFEIDKFRNYIKDKKDKIRTTKNIVEKLIIEDQEMEDIYIDEISRELEKREIEEESSIDLNKEKKLSEIVARIEDKRNNNNNNYDDKIHKDI